MPRKMPTQNKPNRTERLPVVQVTSGERSSYLSKGRLLKYKTFSDFVRDTLDNVDGGHKKNVDHEMIKALLAIGSELNKSGNNLNQIAKKLNAGRQVRPEYFDEVLKKHMELLGSFEEMMNRLMHDTQD